VLGALPPGMLAVGRVRVRPTHGIRAVSPDPCVSRMIPAATGPNECLDKALACAGRMMRSFRSRIRAPQARRDGSRAAR